MERRLLLWTTRYVPRFANVSLLAHFISVHYNRYLHDRDGGSGSGCGQHTVRLLRWDVSGK
jgi:hypothetical protein